MGNFRLALTTPLTVTRTVAFCPLRFCFFFFWFNPIQMGIAKVEGFIRGTQIYPLRLENIFKLIPPNYPPNLSSSI
ncbi:hypothetical protein IEQ34_009710 [Dendrobium chrysotoxum]|uniref:Secreted protein n=1 Tax=Dendrobium chrysotoxum TaxID=161865 RepID=A0AAV7GJW3_DENCH|nr:hypothetical protein IEQ34_009710 [Dendrobium chrysotoxum]